MWSNPAFRNNSSLLMLGVGVGSALAIISFCIKRKSCFLVPETNGQVCKVTFQLIVNIMFFSFRCYRFSLLLFLTFVAVQSLQRSFKSFSQLPYQCQASSIVGLLTIASDTRYSERHYSSKAHSAFRCSTTTTMLSPQYVQVHGQFFTQNNRNLKQW